MRSDLLYSVKLFVVITNCLCLFSCKNEIESPVEMGYEYVQLKQGNWWLYQVDSIIHDDFTGSTDTFRYLVKLSVDSVYDSTSEYDLFRVVRHVYDSANTEWKVSDHWSASLDNARYITNEENDQLIRIVFPVKDGKEWNGMALMDTYTSTFAQDSVHAYSNVNGISFDSTMTIVQQNEDDGIIERNIKKEKYAYGVGLIHQEMVELDLWNNAGYECEMNILSWGIQ